MKQYKVDSQRTKYIKQISYQRHPRWKKRLPLRIFFLALFLGSFIFSYIITKNHPFLADSMITYSERATHVYSTGEYVGSYIGCAFLMGVCPGMLYFIYRYISKTRCKGGVAQKSQQTVILTDLELKSLFHIKGTESNTMTEVRFPYNDIKRIVWNQYFERYEIYGIATTLHYIDYAADKVDHRSTDKDNLKMAYHIQWVYPENQIQDFKREIEQRTGLKVEESMDQGE